MYSLGIGSPEEENLWAGLLNLKDQFLGGRSQDVNVKKTSN